MTPDRPNLNSFESTVSALFSRVRGHIEPGSHRMQRLLKKETLTQLQTIPTILVGGTNGKGSLCALLEQTIRDSKYKTALYTSPHLISPTERIRINGIPINEYEFVEEARRIFQFAQRSLPDATFFELMTAIAFENFVRTGVDALVCEVGLGGRLDSTNITAPTVSVLTSIGLDHTEWLGNDEESIAREKAFISRRNRPLIVGPVSNSARRGVHSATTVTGAIVHYIDEIGECQNSPVPLAQATMNAFTDATSLEILADQVIKSKVNNFWPGRFDLRFVTSVPIIFDAAHNSHSVSFFLNKAELSSSRLPHPWTLVYASLSDKDWKVSIDLLSPHFDAILFTETLNSRSVKADLLLSHACSNGVSCSLSKHTEVRKALENGLERARATGGTLFVLGSITLIGESYEHWAIPVFPSQE